MAQPVLPNSELSPDSCNDTLADVTAAPEQEVEDAEEEEIEGDTGQGCFSFDRSLPQRAAQTYSPYAAPHVKSYVATWEKLVSRIIFQGYEATDAFEEARGFP